MPDFPYEGDGPEDGPDGFITREEVVTYLEDFAATYNPNLHFGVKVSSIEQVQGVSRYLLNTSDGLFEANNVVVATSTFQQPRIPAVAEELAENIDQLHTSQYRNPDTLKAGAVLVVGTGQSGCQIAEELYQSGRKVFLCVGSTGRAPRRYRGSDTTVWMEKMGMFDQTVDKLPSPKHRFSSNPHVSGKAGGRTLNLHQFARDGVVLLGHFEGVQANNITIAPNLKDSLKAVDHFADELTGAIDKFIEKSGLPAADRPTHTALRDGYDVDIIRQIDLKAENINTVIWATGYSFDFSWVKLPLFDEYGYPIHQRGVTEYPGLYFLGLVWLYTTKSSLLAGVGDDAAYIAKSIEARS
jgi:putative flavoprotein involved in K+ transport